MSFPSSRLSPYLLAGKLGAEQAGEPDAGSHHQGCCGNNSTSDGDMDVHGTQGDLFTSCMNQPSGVTPKSVSDKFVMLAELQTSLQFVAFDINTYPQITRMRLLSVKLI